MFSLRSIIKGTKYAFNNNRQVSSGIKPLVDFEVDNGGIGVLTMQRPPVNSLNVELLTDIANALEEADKNKCKGIVLTSTLPNIFCAGMDIKEMFQPDTSRLAELWKSMRRVTSQLLRSSYVSTSAVTGHTSAGGCILAILTEYRVMVNGINTISLNDTALNITPPSWVHETMIHVMGRRQAELALTASTQFLPQEAAKAGLIDDIVTNKKDAIEKCKEFINKSDKIVPFARKKTKENIRKSIIDLWSVESEPDSLQEYIKEVTSTERQKSLELYLQVMKNNKKKKH